MKKINGESGITLVVVALCMTAMLGFMALATNVGIMMHQQRELRAAADSAALAAATELTITGSYAAAENAGMNDAAANGFNASANCPSKANTSGPTICIKEPTNAIDSAFDSFGYVEADISQPATTSLIKAFMGLIHNNSFPAMTVAAKAVAVAAVGNGPGGCIYVMDPKASGAMTLQGSFTVKAPDCSVDINSNSSDALQFTGAGGTLTAGSVGVVGGDGGQVGDSTPAPIKGISQISDPLAFRDLSAEAGQITGKTPNLSCGAYTGTIKMPSTPNLTPLGGSGQINTVAGGTYPSYSAVCYTGTVNMSGGTLPAGVYFFSNATVTLSNVTGTGVSFVFLSGSSLTVAPGANEKVNLTAPTLNQPTSADDNLWNGILFYQPPSNTSEMQLQIGSSSAQLTGIIYAPTAEFYLQDSGGDKSGGVSLTTNLIVGTLFDKTATMTMASYSASQEGSGAGVYPTVTLVQ